MTDHIGDANKMVPVVAAGSYDMGRLLAAIDKGLDAAAGSDDMPEYISRKVRNIRAYLLEYDECAGSDDDAIYWLAHDRERLLDKLECAEHERDEARWDTSEVLRQLYEANAKLDDKGSALDKAERERDEALIALEKARRERDSAAMAALCGGMR